MRAAVLLDSQSFRCLALAAVLATGFGAAPAAAADPPARLQFYDRVDVLCVGIDRYWSKGVPALASAEADAKAFGSALREVYGYSPPRYLLGKDATKKAVEAVLDEYDRELGPGGSLVVYFACHGDSFEHARKDDPVPRPGRLPRAARRPAQPLGQK